MLQIASSSFRRICQRQNLSKTVLHSPKLQKIQTLHQFQKFQVKTIRHFSVTTFRLQDVAEAAKETAVEAGKVTEAAKEAVVEAGKVTEAAKETVAEAVDKSNEIVLDFLPEKPAPVEVLSQHSDAIQYLGEIPFDVLGLASWWPAGRMQYFMEQIHLGLDVPWWGTIMITTVCIRAITLYFVIQAQKNAAVMHNAGPELRALQDKMTDARKRGDMYDSAKAQGELQEFMSKNNYNPFKFILPVVSQMPFFVSMFVGLRGMANLPVASMTDGGLFWFKDLTMVDPFYALPILTSISTYYQLKSGAEGVVMASGSKLMKVGMFVMPGVLFLFTLRFPAAITFYWFTTNVYSLVQAKILRLPKIRSYLGIPKMNKPPAELLPKNPSAGFKSPMAAVSDLKKSFGETYDNFVVQNRVIDYRQIDADRFKKAGTSPIQKTFKYDPTKGVPSRKKK